MLLDFEDYLRHRRLDQWEPERPEARAVREVPRRYREEHPDGPEMTALTDRERWALYAPWLEHVDAAVRANAVICLIHQANYLLDRQIAALEQAFITDGGYSEQLAAARLAERSRRRSEESSNPVQKTEQIPPCPSCGRSMVLRTAKQGPNSGKSFWGCSGYPECKGIVEV